MNNFHVILESFDIYENTHQIIIIGRNELKTYYKILKLSRWTSNEISLVVDDWFLTVSEDEYIYNSDDIKSALSSLIKMTSAKLVMENVCGIVGFIRFKQGYYMIVITKKSMVAKLGQHKIYKVDETKMIYLPGSQPSPWEQILKSGEVSDLPQTKHPDEKRYLALFNNADLSIDNYFSYTYDLSNTVQFNFSYRPNANVGLFDEIHQNHMLLNDRFVWNWSLWPSSLRPNVYRLEHQNKSVIASSWIVPLIHGYVGQSCLLAGSGCVEINVCLIARRSRYFAGTRFLKRGANLFGDVANEVESEQIVYENEGLKFEDSQVTSHVQMRGSIPLKWYQEISKVVRKPPIKLNLHDSYYEITGRHFSDLLYRYGGPVVVLNLVKQKERHLFESPLSKKFQAAIEFLKSFILENSFAEYIIEYIEFDMARIQRNKNKTVLEKLAPIAKRLLDKTGIFQSAAVLRNETSAYHENSGFGRNLIQCGVIRTNCIDCLDRTNTAQFVIGQAAIGHQLKALGVINSSEYSDIQILDQFLQILYENHGNILALQYGGSELVHNIETYKKTGKISTQSRDFVQTISRYLNNKFSDYEKQMSINLFQGIFRPWWSSGVSETIWDHKYSDMYLHDRLCRMVMPIYQEIQKLRHLDTNKSSVWISTALLCTLPKPLSLYNKMTSLQRLFSICEEQEQQKKSNFEVNIKKQKTMNEKKIVRQHGHIDRFCEVYDHLLENRQHFLSVLDLGDDWQRLDKINNGNEGWIFTGNSSPVVVMAPNVQNLANNVNSNVKESGKRSNQYEGVESTKVPSHHSPAFNRIENPFSNVIDCDVFLTDDPVHKLSGGLIMRAVRNKADNDCYSISSSSGANSSDDDSMTTESSKKPQRNALDFTSSFLGCSSYEKASKSKYLKFVIRNYNEDLFNTNIDYINSSASVFKACNIERIGFQKPYNHYYSMHNYSSISVSNESQEMYKDIIKFNRTGNKNMPSNKVYADYCSTFDFKIFT